MTASYSARLGLVFALGLALLPGSAAAQNQTVNIYSYREPGLIAPLLERFEQETGITPVVLYSDAGLIERVAAEGRNSPADLVLTVDVGNLASAKDAGIWQPLDTVENVAHVPEAYRDADGAWTALSMRARVFYVSRDRVPADLAELTYDDLAGPDWAGRICTRSAQHVYSIGLIADYIAHNGIDTARDWLTAVRDNLAMRPTGNDRAQVKSVYAGQCDLAIGNTYYYGLMLTNADEPEQKDWADSVRVIFPNRETTGTHVNVSGAILTKHAPNADNAKKLISFLLSDEGQSLYADANFEYPVVPGVEPAPLVAGWGELVADQIPLTEIAAARNAASALADELQVDGGPRN